METCGACRRTSLLRKKGKARQPADDAPVPKQSQRWLLAELLNDIVYAVTNTEGCVEWLCSMEEDLGQLKQPPGGVVASSRSLD